MDLRIIPRIDVKNSNVVKGVQFEGLRKLGDPNEFGLRYYNEGAHELIFMDIVASLYGRNSLFDFIARATNEIFIPITVGGGIKSVYDVEQMLKSGADKVAINTAAISNPGLISEVACNFGSQCMVLSIEAKKVHDEKWVAYFDSGREKTDINVVDWIKEGIDLGAGEIYVMSVDCEGRAQGCDIGLAKTISSVCSVPLIFGGGIGNFNHYQELCELKTVDAVSISNVLHYDKLKISNLKKL